MHRDVSESDCSLDSFLVLPSEWLVGGSQFREGDLSRVLGSPVVCLLLTQLSSQGCDLDLCILKRAFLFLNLVAKRVYHLPRYTLLYPVRNNRNLHAWIPVDGSHQAAVVVFEEFNESRVEVHVRELLTHGRVKFLRQNLEIPE